MYRGSPGWFTAYVRRADFPANVVLTLVIRDVDKPDARAKLERTVQRTTDYLNIARAYVAERPAKRFAIWSADGVSVNGNDHAVRLAEYDPTSGITSHPLLVYPDGSFSDGVE